MTTTVRKLTAIMAADVAGYSRLMGADEEGTLARLKTHRRELIDPKISGYRGRIVKTTGDGMLVEFASVVDAVKCAVEIQSAMRQRETELPADKLIQFRIGVNVGDVIIDGDDIHGDGVNVAARLEALAEPGTICISGGAWDQVHGKVQTTADDLGDKRLKNIQRAIRVYRISAEVVAPERPALPLPDRPSIAVLPFQNMSGDLEQEYFADGMVEEIITALSRFHWLFVIARNSSFAYKGKAADIKQVARELGVRYVLEGSVRKGGQKVRITGQLIDAATGAHLWADKFDGDVADVFDLQDRVAISVVGAIEPKVRQAEIERSARKPTESLDAYDYFLRAQPTIYATTEEGSREALNLLAKAIECDPRYGLAHAEAVLCYSLRRVQGWMASVEDERRIGLGHIQAAVDFAKDDPTALWMSGHGAAVLGRDIDRATTLFDRSLSLNSNSAQALSFSGWNRIYAGDSATALSRFESSMRLSPFDPYAYVSISGTAVAHFFVGNFDESVKWSEAAIRENPKFHGAYYFLAAAQIQLGWLDAAHKTIADLRGMHPTAKLPRTSGSLLSLRNPQFGQYRESLAKASLLE